MLGFKVQGFCVLVLLGITFRSGESANLTDLFGGLNFDGLLKLDKLEDALSLLEKLTSQCKQNNVEIDMTYMIQRYMCLSQMNSILVSQSPITDKSYLDSVCEEWPQSFKCVKPLLTKLEKCFSSPMVNLKGVLTGGIEVVKEQMCKDDPSFVDSLREDGPELLSCLSIKSEAVVLNVVECFSKSKQKGITDLCSGFDVYKKCFLDSVSLCKSPKAEKLIYKLVEEVGFKKVIYNNMLKCGEKVEGEEVKQIKEEKVKDKKEKKEDSKDKDKKEKSKDKKDKKDKKKKKEEL